MLIQTARLWRSLGHHDSRGRLRIDGVTGPDEYSAIDYSNDRWAGGTGFRYLVARQYDLRMGCDVARGPEDWAFYVTIGTGWLRD